MERRLAAILAADVVGYSHLMSEDEEGTLAALKKSRATTDPIIVTHHGRIFGSAGDSLVAEFASPVEAVRCAMEIQSSLKQINEGLPDEKRMLLRIGINLGDIMVDGDNLMGDVVNIAVRLEGLADPGGVCVSRTVLDHVSDKVDFGFDFQGEKQVKNISRPVGVYRVRPDSMAPVASRPVSKSRKPVVIVLPFSDRSPNADQAFFSEGIAEDIITNLARFEELVVIAQQSAFAFKESNADACEFSEQLGVGYALDGGVQRALDRVRVSVRLIEISTRATLWAERFERDVTDIFTVQDEIAGAIVNALVGEVSDRHVELLQSQGPRQMGAYDHVLRAQRLIWSISREDIARARAEVEAALALEPDFARAHVLLAWAHLTEDGNGWGESGELQYEKSVAHARIAVALDNKNPWAHALLGVSKFWRDRETVETLTQVRHGVDLHPSNAHLRMLLGAQLAYMGQGEEAVDQLNYAISLNPLFPDLYLLHRSRALFVLGRYNEALADAIRATAVLQRHPTALAMLATCRGAVGHSDEAKAAVNSILESSPEFSLSFARKSYPYCNPEHLERFCELLQAAGLPE